MASNMDTIRDLAQQDYKWGFVTESDDERAPRGLNEDIVRFISAKKHEPEWMLQWRLKAYRHWLTLEGGADVGQRSLRADRLPGHHLLLGAKAEAWTQEPGRSRSGDAEHLRKAGHPARRAGTAGRRGGRCGFRQRFCGDHVQGQAGRDGHHFLLVLRGRCASIRSW